MSSFAKRTDPTVRERLFYNFRNRKLWSQSRPDLLWTKLLLDLIYCLQDIQFILFTDDSIVLRFVAYEWEGCSLFADGLFEFLDDLQKKKELIPEKKDRFGVLPFYCNPLNNNKIFHRLF